MSCPRRPGLAGPCRPGWIVLALGAFALAAQAVPAPDPPPADEDVLLFELRLDQVTLHESFPAFPGQGGVRIPLGELCRALELGIQVDPALGVADGFLITEGRRFHLDARTGVLTVGKTSTTLDRSLLELRPDDLYLDTRLVAQCLPLNLEVGLRASVLTVVSREPLPLQARWRRDGVAGRLGQAAQARTFAPLADPYRWAEVPAVDLALGLAAASGGGGRSVTPQGSLQAAGDLLGLSANLYALAQSPGGLSDFHATLGRNDPHGGLLGPLRATAFSVGEVFTPGLSLAALPRGGTGALVTNFPVQADGAFDRHSFRGELAPGWQVELYQNQGLIALQGSRPDGRYEFLNVPLTFGWNDFLLVFYGPLGQRREERVQFDVTQSQTPAGTFLYHAVGLEGHDGLGRRSQLQASFGLTRQLSATFGATQAVLDGVTHAYTQAGLQGYGSSLGGSLTAGRDSRGGSVGELALGTRLGSLSLTAKGTAMRDGFRSEIFQPQYGLIRRRTTLAATVALPGVQRAWLTLDAGGYRDDLAGGGSVDTTHGRLSATCQGWFLANQVTRTLVRDLPSPVPTATRGELLVSKLFAGVGLRGQATYTLDGARKLESLTCTADTSRFRELTLQTTLSRQLLDGATTLSLGLAKTRGAFSLGGNLACSTRTGLSANLTFRLGLARDPREGHVFARAQGAAAFGAVSAEAFLDSNGNGRRDPGEKPLPNLAFTVNGATQPNRTDAQGVAFLQGLPQGQDAQIALDPAALEDPLMRPALAGVRVTPRGGHVMRLDVPVNLYGEINGTSYLLQGGKRKECPGLRLELRDAAGQVVRSLRTAYDGFYTLDGLPPGTYRLDVPEAAAKALGAPPPPARILTLSPEGSILDGVDVVMEPIPGQIK